MIQYTAMLSCALDPRRARQLAGFRRPSSRFPDDGVILRPGGIYGDRRVGSVTLPLGFVMGPMEMVSGCCNFSDVSLYRTEPYRLPVPRLTRFLHQGFVLRSGKGGIPSAIRPRGPVNLNDPDGGM